MVTTGYKPRLQMVEQPIVSPSPAKIALAKEGEETRSVVKSDTQSINNALSNSNYWSRFSNKSSRHLRKDKSLACINFNVRHGSQASSSPFFLQKISEYGFQRVETMHVTWITSGFTTDATKINHFDARHVHIRGHVAFVHNQQGTRVEAQGFVLLEPSYQRSQMHQQTGNGSRANYGCWLLRRLLSLRW